MSSSVADYLHMAEGRLTLTQGTPVTTSDVTAATYVYYEPYLGDRLALWNGGKWVPIKVLPSTLRVGVPATTVTPFDVFGYMSGGYMVLGTVNWTSDTARATSLASHHGVYVLSNNYAWRYLGTSRTTSSSGQTEDSYGGAHQSGGKRFLWNMHNRVLRQAGVIDTTDSWTYSTATWRQANNNTGNKVECVLGLSVDAVEAMSSASCTHSSSAIVSSGVGVDSTSTNSAQQVPASGAVLNAQRGTPFGVYIGFPAVGYHALNWLEISQATATTTWYGDGGIAYLQTGLQAKVWA